MNNNNKRSFPLGLDKRVRFDEKYNWEEEFSVVYYFTADKTLLDELVGKDKYPDADGMTLSVELPNNIWAYEAAIISISPYKKTDEETSDYDWEEIDLPEEEFIPLMCLTSRLTGKKAREVWREIVRLYKESNRPDEAIASMVKELSYDTVAEVFAIVSAIKAHDGRIYGKEREFISKIPYDPSVAEWKSGNEMRGAGLDDIHPAHIHQLIHELMKVKGV